MAKWETGQVPALREALTNPAAAAPAAADDAKPATRPLWPNNHASSPVLNKPAATAYDDEPPF
jgi:hypothetical protein